MDTVNNLHKAWLQKLPVAAASMLATCMMLLSAPALADDTEVFLGAGSASSNIKPNVLFIIDTSGSMDWDSDTPGQSRLEVMQDALTQILNKANDINVGLMTFNSRGGPVRYPISYIDADASEVENGGFNITTPVASSTDDAEENIDTLLDLGTVTTDDDFLHISESSGTDNATELTVSVDDDSDDGEEAYPNGDYNGGSSDLDTDTTQLVGLRFRNVAIPAGAVIVSAELLLTISSSENTPTSFQIWADASDSATPLSGNKTLKNRPATANTLTWGSVPAADRRQTISSPNLNQVVQEVVGRPGWASGNNLAFTIKTTNGARHFYSHEGTNSWFIPSWYTPRLRISYTMNVTPVRKLAGLRFNDIKIPQGAQIQEAYLDFTSGEDSSDPVTYKIYGEATPDSTTFDASSVANISTRTKTAAAVDWNLLSTDVWQAGSQYSTPDLTSVIQEIVNQGSWCGGNSLSLLLEPSTSAQRLMESYDGAQGAGTSTAPTLRIKFDTDTQNITAPNTGCLATEVSARVNSTNDDAEERTSNGALSTGSSDLEMIEDNGKDQYVGIRFNDIQVSPGAQITSAYVEFTARNSTSTSTSLTIKGHKVANSPAFEGNSNISNRFGSTTTASVDWNNIPSWNDGSVYQTPDLKDIIQEIVDQGGWQKGNSLSLLINGSGTRRAESYNGDAARAPRLVIETKQNLAGVPSVSGQTVRQKLIQEVNGLRTVAGTPLVNTYMEGIRYFRGMPAYWGKFRGYQNFYDRYSRVSHSASWVGGALNRPAGCNEFDLNDSDCIDEVINFGPVYVSPMKDACQANYIVILSDGDQNEYSDDGIANLLATAPAGSGFPSSCSGANGGADCGLKLAEFAKKFDQNASLDGDQTITTYAIGFTFTSDFMRDLATKGGGLYRTANNADELVDAFETFFGDILSKPTTFTAPTLTVSAFNRLFNSNEIYISLFEPERTAKWSGNVKKYFLCTPAQNDAGTCTTGELMDNTGQPAAADGQIKPTAQSAWSDIEDGADVQVGGAGMQVPAYGSRRIYTYTGSTTPVNVDISATEHQVKVSNGSLTAAMLGVPTDERDDLVAWITGQDIDDENNDTITNENRWVFGDPLHSAAITVNYGVEGSTPVTKLFVGTNDGGFRMINTKNGAEEWMFIPQHLLEIQQDLRNNVAGATHIYGVDGSPVDWVYDADGDVSIEKSDGDFVKLFVGERRGGDNYYALDVTPDSPVTDATATGLILPKLMWRLNSATTGFSRLGQTWSKPFRTRVLVEEAGATVVKNVLIFGGGYDTGNDATYGPLGTDAARSGNAIYIADANTGEFIWSASSTTGASVVVPDMKYSIPSDVRLLDVDGDGATDRLIVGDVGGQIWRVDLGVINSTTNGPIVGKLAALSDNTAASLAADHRRFMYAPQVVLVNDSDYSDPANAEYMGVAITSGDRANPLAENVHDRTYLLRDFQTARMPDNNGDGLADAGYPTITNADLYDATSGVTAVADLDGLKASSGWYINLKEDVAAPNDYIGEKGITEGRVLISSVPSEPPVIAFNTYTPGATADSSACTVTLGTNRTYFINLLNGTGTDIINEVTKTRSRINEAFGIAPELSISQQEGQTDITIRDNPTGEDVINYYLGDMLLPIYSSEK